MKKQPSRPGGERHFETGRSAVRDSIRAYAENDGWRVESCPPVENGPVIITNFSKKYNGSHIAQLVRAAHRLGSNGKRHPI